MDRLRRNLILVLVSCGVLIILAFCLGLVVKNWPILTLDQEMSISDVLGHSITVLLAISIPFFINHFIDRSNKVNSMVLDEVRRYRDHLDDIQQRVYSIHKSEQMTGSNKTELIVLCEILDSKLEILSDILKSRDQSKFQASIDNLESAQVDYWKTLTGSSVNSSSVTALHPITLRSSIQLHQNLTATLTSINILVSEN